MKLEEALSRGAYERPDGRWKIPGKNNLHVMITCSVCGDEYLANPSKGGTAIGPVCSRPCKDEGLKSKTGAAHHRWSGIPLQDMNYKQRHARAVRIRGNAKDQSCIDCGRTAYDWSTIDPEATTVEDMFVPRCRSCHRRFDESNHCAKLTTDLADEIRKKYNEGGVRQIDLAEEYGVGQTAISRITRGESYAEA